MSAELLIKAKKNESFNEFVAAWLEFIRCGQWEQRQSKNYVDNSYIRCSMFGVEITVGMIEDVRFREYNFLLRFEPEIESRTQKISLTGFADSIARKLATLGYEAIRPYDRQLDGRAIHTQPNPDKDIRACEKVLAEEVLGMPSQQFSFNLKIGA